MRREGPRLQAEDEGPAKDWRRHGQGEGGQRRWCQEGGHDEQPPRLRENTTLTTETPPSLVAEDVDGLCGMRGQSRGQTSAAGGAGQSSVSL